MRIENKVFVVTGAGSGMGRQLTLELVKRRARVAAVDLRAETLAETQKMAGDKVATFALDITDGQKVAKLPAQVIERFGSIDGLINNAGIIQPFVKINELSLAQADRVMAVNFTGPLMLTKAFLPELLKRPEAHILNVSSMGAYAPVPGQSVYGASKAALKLFTEGLRSELLATKVGVTIAFPGAINTNIAQNSGMALPAADTAETAKFKMTEADVAARAMINAIEKNKPRITIGTDATMMDRLSRLNPVMAANIIYKQMKSLLG